MEESKIRKSDRLLIIGGSAGSLEVLLDILPKLNPVSSFIIVIVLHRKSGEDNMLEDLISFKSKIPFKETEDKVELEPGYLYVAPSDYHLLIENTGHISLDTSEKINYSRPSIDVAFESAAEVYGKNLTGVLLSGANADGTAGLEAIKKKGGTTIVQQPDTAEVAFMPLNAILNSPPDLILSTSAILEYINSL